MEEQTFKTYEEYKEPLIRKARSIGYNLNLDNPVTIQDKLNWLKLYDSTPLKTKCADKIRVHEYCKEKIGEDLCIPILHIYNKVEDIKWDELPDRFVIKCNHGSGMNIIVKDKSKLNIPDAERKLKRFMADDFAFHVGYEMHYHDIPHKIFVEEYKEDENQKDSLYDYKFWCFNGEPKFFTVSDGFGHGNMTFFNMDFTKSELSRTDFTPIRKDIVRPKTYNLMVEYAKILSGDFKFVRVDFYEIGGKLYLGELTFIPGCGFFKYRKSEDNVRIGNFLRL